MKDLILLTLKTGWESVKDEDERIVWLETKEGEEATRGSLGSWALIP